MKIDKLQTPLLCLFAGTAIQLMNGQAPASPSVHDVGTLMVNIVYSHSGGIVRLNGIPIERFGKGDPESGDSGTLLIGNGVSNYGINGVNTLSVEAKAVGPEQGSSTEVLLYDARAASENPAGATNDPFFRKKIAGAGTIQYSLALRNVPHHIFDDATPWNGDPNAVSTAVQALHKALVVRDMKAIAGIFRPSYDGSPDAQRLGSFDDMIGEFEKSLKGSKVADLPMKLNVESFYNGRLLRVTGADDRAPIRSASITLSTDGRPDELLEMGDFWCYRNGAWILLPD